MTSIPPYSLSPPQSSPSHLFLLSLSLLFIPPESFLLPSHFGPNSTAFCLQRQIETTMAFQGTTTKCTACDKTVYLVDKLVADKRAYHKACFRCHHCNGTLKLGNYNSFEGVLYCKPHFDQLYKSTGSLDKSFEGIPKVVKPEKPVDTENASRVSSAFVGTKEKCVGCEKTVYPTERVKVNGAAYHKSCFKCCHGGCVISPSNYIAHDGKLYCKHHHTQLIKEKGNLSQLEADREKSSSADEEAAGESEAPWNVPPELVKS